MLAVQPFSFCQMCGLVCDFRGRSEEKAPILLPSWIAFIWMPENQRSGAKTSAGFGKPQFGPWMPQLSMKH